MKSFQSSDLHLLPEPVPLDLLSFGHGISEVIQEGPVQVVIDDGC